MFKNFDGVGLAWFKKSNKKNKPKKAIPIINY